MRLTWLFIATAFILFGCGEKEDPIPVREPISYVTQKLQGFSVKMRKSEQDHPDIKTALNLLDEQLKEINELLREPFLTIVKHRPIWLKLDLQPQGAAWYHPSKEWLSTNGHNPDKAFSVEISNARNFVAWSKQNQPFMVLHEMAHLIHHQYYGHDYHGILPVFNKAKNNGLYESVPYFGTNTTNRKAYALTNDQEYFAELTEAFFGQNDYFPFNYEDLKEYDSEGYFMMYNTWGPPPGKTHPMGIQPPSASLGLDKFYEKHMDASGLPVISSWQVHDNALLRTKEIVDFMVSALPPEALSRMISSKVRVGVIGVKQVTSDMPEYKDLSTVWPGTNWDQYRGLGPTAARPLCSAGEENLLMLPADPYSGENILVHEFAHAIDLMGLRPAVSGFESRLKEIYGLAMAEGLWKNTYAASNSEEYFAEGVQSWFNVNRSADPPDGIHNNVNTREKLMQYDKRLFDLIADYFPEDDPEFGL